jgi:hypothetical protein
MKPVPKSSEKRQSVRWPVAGQRQEAELRFGKKHVKALLVDESAGGFSALCEQAAGIKAGEKGLLCTGEDWFEVSVVSIESDEQRPFVEHDVKLRAAELFQSPARQDSAIEPLSGKTPPLSRLGLARLGDTYDPNIQPSYYSLAGLTCHLKQVSPGSWGVILVGMLLAIIVVIIPVATVKMISSDAADAEIKEGAQWLSHKNTAHAKAPENDRPNAVSGISAQELQPSSPSNDTIGDLRKTIRHLPGAMPFSLPEVVKQLQLTPSQQQKIRELVEAASNLIKNLGDFPDKSDGKEKKLTGKDILKNTRKKVLELLDEDQKKKWNELTGELDKEEKKENK